MRHSLQCRARRRLVRTLSASAVALLLGACAGFQDITASAGKTPDISIAIPGNIDAVPGAWPRNDWWTTFGDPQLNRLVGDALANSPNLATAQARISRANAAVTLSNAARALQMNFSGEASYGRQSENYLNPRPPLGTGGEWVSKGQTAVSFDYDLDFWDRNGALIRSAQSQAIAAMYDRSAAELALTTSIARAYAQLASQYELQDVLLATLKQRQAISDLTRQRVANGLDTRVELKQNETSEAALRADLAQVSTQIEVTRIQLAALAGEMPASASGITRPQLVYAAVPVPADLPLDLLARRPELAAQSARISAAIGEAKAAKAQFYPNISLNGLAGLQAIGLDELLNPGSVMTSIGPAIHLPLFDGGRLRANYAIRSADIDIAVTQYNQSVIGAAQEVAEQLTRIASLSREEDAIREALTAAEEAHRTAMLRYRAGLSPYLTVLTVETQLLLQRRAAVDLDARRHDLQLTLIRALGGGFHAQAHALQPHPKR